MKLFENRPLSLILCIMLGGFSLFTRGNTIIKISTIAMSLLLLLLFIISLIKNKKRYILLFSSVALCFSILFSYLYFGQRYNLEEEFKDGAIVEGVVCEENNPSTYYKKYTIRAKKINDENFYDCKLVMYVENDIADYISVGSYISFRCIIENFDAEYAEYNYAKGLRAACNEISEITVIDTDRFVPEATFSYLREIISRHAKMMTDAESGSMISALLLGERDMLSDQVELDFRRLGITHLLALSGLHLAILAFALEKIMRLFGTKETFRCCLTIIFTLAYMALTGFPVSVRRAGIMLILSKLLTLLLKDTDSLTSLFISTALICFTTPYSVYDISLWLSSFATLGVIVFSELRSEIKKKLSKNRLLSGIILSISISAFAIAATLFITQFSFDGFSIISPLTTLIFSILVEIIIYLGGIILIVGWIIPLGWLISPIVKLTTSIAAYLSSLDIYVSKDHIIIDILAVLLTVMFFAFLIIDIKSKRKAAFTVICVLTLCFISGGALSYASSFDDKIIYFNEDNSDTMLIRSNKETAIISSAKYSTSTGYDLIEILNNQKLHTLDKYLASHYSWKLAEEINILLSNIPVNDIYLPEPANNDEKAILNKIRSTIGGFRTEIHTIKSTEILSIGEYKFRQVYNTPYGTDTAQSVYMLYGNGKSYAYISSGALTGKGKSYSQAAINQATDIIFGNNGKTYKNKTYFKAESPKANNIIFSSDNLIIPSNTAYYYIKNGCKIHSHPKEFVLAD